LGTLRLGQPRSGGTVQMRPAGPPRPDLLSFRNVLGWSLEGLVMKKKLEKAVEQPKPVTPGVTKAMVRQHAFELFRDKLPEHPLTLEDWVLAEKDLVNSMETDNLLK
jgi:hypothetical protein